MRLSRTILTSMIAASALLGGTAEARPVAKKAAAVKKAPAKRVAAQKKRLAPAKLVSWSVYSQWPKKKQQSYMGHLRRMLFAWETKAYKKMKFTAHNEFAPKEFFQLFPEAYAGI
jgi:hypothetical protein